MFTLSSPTEKKRECSRTFVDSASVYVVVFKTKKKSLALSRVIFKKAEITEF